MAFVLDAELEPGRAVRFDASDDALLARALFAIRGVRHVEARDATVWVKRDPGAEWAALKPAVAKAIREVLDETDTPLGGGGDAGHVDDDAKLLEAVEALLKREINPAVSAHGGEISVDRVEGGVVYLRMSGGCQGCAASSTTLRLGVERTLRAALPRIGGIVDVTDHAGGRNPYHARGGGASPLLNRPVPDDVIAWEDGRVTVDPGYLAPRLGLTPETLREGLRHGEVVGVTETGEGADAGKTRIVLRSATRAWAAEIDETGSAREIPPPRSMEAASGLYADLATRLRDYLEALRPDAAPIAYGALARALGLWAPGSVGKVTRALETTMREDAAASRPFIAARAVSRGRDGLPGKGFFDLARALSRGPWDGEDEASFHDREMGLLNEALAGKGPAGATSK
jgi:Fe-S cluster biogenesis protein NfuA